MGRPGRALSPSPSRAAALVVPLALPLAPALAIALALAAPTFAQAEQVHLGLPDPDASTSASVVWLEPTPNPQPAVVLVTPAGEEIFIGQQVPGPSAGIVYEARLTGLVPDTFYTYRVGDRAFELTTPPAALAEGASFSFVALGDMGTTAHSADTVVTIQALAPDFVLHAGDLSYAQGDPVAWKAWFDLVEPVAASSPWLPALGNHETYTGPGPAAIPLAAAGVPSPAEIAFFRQRFGLPNNELWYSFDWASVHFVALDTFSEREGPSPEQIAWLEDDLIAHGGAPWTIAYLHEPPYSSNDHGSSERAQQAFVGLLEEHGVDLVIAGHDHAYERTYQMWDSMVVNDDPSAYFVGAGTVYVVTGGGGQSLYAQWDDPAPEWSAARGDLYHVTACTVSLLELACRLVPTDGDAFEDAFHIVQEPPPPADGEELPDATPLPVAVLLLAAPLAAAWARRR